MAAATWRVARKTLIFRQTGERPGRGALHLAPAFCMIAQELTLSRCRGCAGRCFGRGVARLGRLERAVVLRHCAAGQGAALWAKSIQR